MKKLVLTGAALVALASATYAQVVQQVGQQQFAQPKAAKALLLALIRIA